MAKGINENVLADKRCPECGQRERLRIEVMKWVVFIDSGTDEEEGDSEWTDSSGCTCPVCGFAGSIQDFESELTDAEFKAYKSRETQRYGPVIGEVVFVSALQRFTVRGFPAGLVTIMRSEPDTYACLADMEQSLTSGCKFQAKTAPPIELEDDEDDEVAVFCGGCGESIEPDESSIEFDGQEYHADKCDPREEDDDEDRLTWKPGSELDAPIYVRVRDDVMTYCAGMWPGMTLREMCDSFASTYDHNGEGGIVSCTATLIVDGRETESMQFECAPAEDEN